MDSKKYGFEKDNPNVDSNKKNEHTEDYNEDYGEEYYEENSDEDEENNYIEDTDNGDTVEYRFYSLLKELTERARSSNPGGRKEIWKEIVRELQQMTVDLYSDRIEDGIAELVAGLNILGIKTGMSCEGHPPFGVSVSNKDGKEVKYVNWKSPWISFEYMPDESKIQKLQQFINEFYKGKDIKKEYTIAPYTNNSRYQGIAIDHDSNREIILHEGDDEKASIDQVRRKVEKQQDEIRAFTVFLRQKFIDAGFT